ncbi:CRML protein, partial [Polyodon spathula]|nr:CRML protein [Polyodon spathula]
MEVAEACSLLPVKVAEAEAAPAALLLPMVVVETCSLLAAEVGAESSLLAAESTLHNGLSTSSSEVPSSLLSPPNVSSLLDISLPGPPEDVLLQGEPATHISDSIIELVINSAQYGGGSSLSPAKLNGNDSSKSMPSPSSSPQRSWIASPTHDPQWYPSDSSDSSLGCLLSSLISPDKGRKALLASSGHSSGTALLGPSLLDGSSRDSFVSRSLADVGEALVSEFERTGSASRNSSLFFQCLSLRTQNRLCLHTVAPVAVYDLNLNPSGLYGGKCAFSTPHLPRIDTFYRMPAGHRDHLFKKPKMDTIMATPAAGASYMSSILDRADKKIDTFLKKDSVTCSMHISIYQDSLSYMNDARQAIIREKGFSFSSMLQKIMSDTWVLGLIQYNYKIPFQFQSPSAGIIWTLLDWSTPAGGHSTRGDEIHAPSP